MLKHFLVIYRQEYDFTKQDRYKIILAPMDSTWRDLQKNFDPGYHHDNLRFFHLGEKIPHPVK